MAAENNHNQHTVFHRFVWIYVAVTTTPFPTPQPLVEYQVATWSLLGVSLVTMFIIAALGITLWRKTKSSKEYYWEAFVLKVRLLRLLAFHKRKGWMQNWRKRCACRLEFHATDSEIKTVFTVGLRYARVHCYGDSKDYSQELVSVQIQMPSFLVCRWRHDLFICVRHMSP